MLSVVMYHYVRDYARPGHGNMRGLDVADFDAQVAAMKAAGGFASAADVFACLDGTIDHQPGRFLLTFDDGLKDCVTSIAPVLRKHGAPGAFHLITRATDGGFVPTAHKIHVLMGDVGPTEFQRACEDTYRRLFGAGFWRALDEDRVSETYRWDPDPVRRFKWTLNFALSEDERVALVDTIFAAGYDEAAVNKSLFMSWDDVEALRASGHAIGGHTHSHANLGSLLPGQQRAELLACTHRLRARGIHGRLPFSYPFGKAHNYDAHTIGLLQKLGYGCAFVSTVGSHASLTTADRFEICRIDPKDVNHFLTRA